MLQHALKEWAVICQALAEGKQSLILRKGGIEESGEEFRLEHTRFWLYPTYVHQQESGIKPAARPFLQEVETQRPPDPVVRLSLFAEAAGVYVLHDIVGAMLLSPFHLWSDETIHSRFAYRQPGLYAIVLRVFRSREVFEVPNDPSYAGCRSWVTLDRDLPTEGATPVLSDGEFQDLVRRIERLLKPTALA